MLISFLILLLTVTGCAGKTAPASQSAADKSQNTAAQDAAGSPAGNENKADSNTVNSKDDFLENIKSGKPETPSANGTGTNPPASTSQEAAETSSKGKTASDLSGKGKTPSTKEPVSGSSSGSKESSTGNSGASGDAQASPAAPGTKTGSASAAKPPGEQAGTTAETKPAAGGAQPSVPDKPESGTLEVQKPGASEAKAENTVTISIVADQDTGTVLAPTSVEIEKGDTVLDILKRITRKNKIQMEFSGRGAAAYVEGINNVYEFDHGSESGWMYRVGGEFPNKSAGAYKVKAGDVVEWLYTLDLGKDLGEDLKRTGENDLEILSIDALSFRYPDAAKEALVNLSLSVQEGEFLVLCGASGCGKTTLLRQLKHELAPEGERKGIIRFQGTPVESLSPQAAAEQIGFVFQNPENQIVMDTVWHELAFGMENLGYPLSHMRKRLAEMVHFFGLEPLLYKSVHELSGGQKQLVNLASVLLLGPKLLLLDEPCAQLDPVASREFLDMVHRLNQELSMTIILSEHRLEDVIPIADRVVMLSGGEIKYAGSPQEISRRIGAGNNLEDRAYLPAVTRLYLGEPGRRASLQDPAGSGTVPVTVREGRQWLHSLDSLPQPGDRSRTSRDRLETDPGDAVLTCRELTFKYGRDTPEILKKLSLNVYADEWLAVVGGNGAGKSTLLQVMSGLLLPQRGKVKRKEHTKIGYLAQNPLLYFTQDTVEKELQHAARLGKLMDPEAEIARLLDLLGIYDLADSHPHDLSGGQQQRVALALVLLPKPDILCLDEPTKGLDPLSKQRFARLLDGLRHSGTSIVMVTHDVEFAALHATRCAMLFDGAITSEGSPSSFFSDNVFYTTAINRTIRGWLPDALTCEDVWSQWPDTV
ncbi:putative ABC transporter ATP-binding protein [Phytophthora fragariae]|uniref:Putative ABC transporter ATP-binding protein n=1 Tax=Phytophthora fragariae TaxID=53985 RepID=A0A6G0LXZ1_9STRA|nr:putative ABC transporter ATP-binding protein [Phytophthora fragariae]